MLGYVIGCDIVLTFVPKETIVSKDESKCPEHLDRLFHHSKKVTNKEETETLKSLLVKFQDIFSEGSHDLGCFKE